MDQNKKKLKLSVLEKKRSFTNYFHFYVIKMLKVKTEGSIFL